MRERPEEIAKFVCLALGTLLFIRFIWIIFTANPLAHVAVPDLPALPEDSSPTNQAAIASSAVNPPAHTNHAQNSMAGTNLAVLTTNMNAPSSIGTNADSSSAPGTNMTSMRSGRRHRGANPFGGGMGFMPGQEKTTVAPVIQASIDRITDSEILGPVIHPLPMALLGIAGNFAFLRSPDGQTGLVKEGDELGSIKLIKIGTNRVLIEEDGQKKELTIFDGLGGETLLNKSVQSTNENHNP